MTPTTTIISIIRGIVAITFGCIVFTIIAMTIGADPPRPTIDRSVTIDPVNREPGSGEPVVPDHSEE